MLFDSMDRLVVVGTNGGLFKRYIISGGTITEDTSFVTNVNNFIFGVYPSPATGGYYIIGGFTQVDGQVRQGGLARVTSSGALDTTFGDYWQSGTLSFNGRPFFLETPEGKVHVRNLRLNSDATRDSTWNATASGPNITEISRIVSGFQDPTGNMVLCYTNNVRRFLPNGDADPSFIGPATTTFGSLIMTTGGQVYLGGDFNATASTGNRSDLIRLNYESTGIGFSSPPSDLTVDQGQPATFDAGVYGADLNYKWYQNGSLLTNGGRITGANSAILTVASTTVADSGSFRLEITNASGLASRTAFLTVTPAPGETFATWSELATVPANLRGPLDDPDGDRIPNLVEFALASAPGSFDGNPHPLSFASANGQVYPTITFTRRSDLAGVTLSVEVSSDLTYTTDLGSQIVSITDNNNGTETVVVRSSVAQGAIPSQYLRLRAE
jgi:hypothetical protein